MNKYPLNEIVLDPRLDLRVKRSEQIIQEYMEKYHELPKPKIFYIKEKKALFLVDGFHRIEAAKRLKITHEYFEDCGKGTFFDAFKIAVASNEGHGQPLKRPDWVKLCESYHRERLSVDPKWTIPQTALALELKLPTVYGYFRRPNGRFSPPVDHNFSSRPEGTNLKREKRSELDCFLDQASSNIASCCGALVKALHRFPLDKWSQEQKDKMFKIAQRFEDVLPEEIFNPKLVEKIA